MSGLCLAEACTILAPANGPHSCIRTPRLHKQCSPRPTSPGGSGGHAKARLSRPSPRPRPPRVPWNCGRTLDIGAADGRPRIQARDLARDATKRRMVAKHLEGARTGQGGRRSKTSGPNRKVKSPPKNVDDFTQRSRQIVLSNCKNNKHVFHFYRRGKINRRLIMNNNCKETVLCYSLSDIIIKTTSVSIHELIKRWTWPYSLVNWKFSFEPIIFPVLLWLLWLYMSFTLSFSTCRAMNGYLKSLF